MSYRVLILACSASKLEVAAPAIDIYTGAIFRKGREYAQREGLWTMILSAKYGLINWDHPVSPYNQKMAGNYYGPWALPGGPAPEGFYLGGSLYFRHAPTSLKPLVPSGTIGFMLRDLNRLLAGTPREELFK
jgi:hypothetical protein